MYYVYTYIHAKQYSFPAPGGWMPQRNGSCSAACRQFQPPRKPYCALFRILRSKMIIIVRRCGAARPEQRYRIAIAQFSLRRFIVPDNGNGRQHIAIMNIAAARSGKDNRAGENVRRSALLCVGIRLVYWFSGMVPR